MKFIRVVHNPRPEALRESKRQARSYSAQVAHARARKLRGQGKSQKDAKEKGLEAEVPSTELQRSQGRILNQTLSGYDHETLSTPELRLYQPNLVPYISFLATLTVEECFMFDHYIKVVMPYLETHCPIARSVGQYHNYIKSNWIIVSSQDLDFIRGFLLVASRHLSMVASKIEFEQKALQYKLEYIKRLRQDVSMQPMLMNPRSVTSALVLAYDEILLGDISMALQHVHGAASLVQAAGGPQALGLSQFISYILFSCVQGDRIGDWAWVLKYNPSFMKADKEGG